MTRCSALLRFPFSGMTRSFLVGALLYLGSGMARGQGFQGFRLLGISLDTLLLTEAPRVNPAYVTSYYRRLHLFVVSDRQQYGLHLTGLSRPLVYRPNLAWTLGAGIDYKWIGAELTVKLPLLGYDVARKGSSKPFGLTFNFNNRRVWISTQYQFYRGFYPTDPNVLEPDWFARHAAYPYRNDLRSQTVLGTVTYLFDPTRVSIPATLLQREAQKKSVGSWVLGGRLTYQLLRGDSTWVPANVQPDGSPASVWLRSNALSVGVDGGYLQTFVFRKHYFTTVSLRPGLAVLSQQRITEGGRVGRQWQPGWYGLASFTLGYTSDNYYGGIYTSLTLLERSFADPLAAANTQYFRVVVGRRLRYRPKGIIEKIPGL